MIARKWGMMKPVRMFFAALIFAMPGAVQAAVPIQTGPPQLPPLQERAVDHSKVFWFEAEDYSEQRGSLAAKFDMPSASGHACVDNDWGGRKGDFLRFKLKLPAEYHPLHVALRYARQTAGESLVRVTIDGKDDLSGTVILPSTGDWGFKREGWKYAMLRLPECASGEHTLEILSLADSNNVNFDGVYLSEERLDPSRAVAEPPSGPEELASLGAGLFALPCQTPVALPYSRRKALVAGSGLVQSLLSSPALNGIGQNVAGPSLHVKLTGHGPWQQVEQTLVNSPVPTVVTRMKWPTVDVQQAVFAGAPEESGYFVRVTVKNTAATENAFELVSLVCNADDAQITDGPRLMAGRQALLRMLPSTVVSVTAERIALPGPLGSESFLRHQLKLPGGASASFDLQFLGDAPSRDEAFAAATRFWEQKLREATPVRLPNPKMQFAYDASLRQMLMLIESRPDHARSLKGLRHYYGANPYDTFQVSRALDAVGLKGDAEELLRHQLRHLKADGIFEMWETGDLQRQGADQWIVQGLAATALWEHYERWRDEGWLRDIAPILIKAAQATLAARRSHAGIHKQGAIEIEGWLPPGFGDGGLEAGYHWSQNAGPLNGVRVAAEAAQILNLPEAEALRAGWLDYQQAFDKVRERSAAADPENLLSSFPGAEGAQRMRPLWGVVMSVSAFDAVAPNDAAAVKTLRFLQKNLHGGLHLNLGYSRGVWPYLSAEVAQWHLRLGETDEAWRILNAIVDRASSTVCWYEEIDHDPPRGFGDPADVWAAAEVVYLTHTLLLAAKAKESQK